MSESMVVAWEADAPFFQLVERLISRAARHWGGEPTEALGEVWCRLRECFNAGEVIDPSERGLATIVFRKVHHFYSRREKPLRSRVGWVSLAEVGESSHSQAELLTARRTCWRRTRAGRERSKARVETPAEGIANRELRASFEAALADLSPRRREAVLVKFKLGDTRSVEELALRWNTTPQNVYKLARKGFEELQRSKSLRRFT